MKDKTKLFTTCIESIQDYLFNDGWKMDSETKLMYHRQKNRWGVRIMDAFTEQTLEDFGK